jgi:hypothetical protein
MVGGRDYAMGHMDDLRIGWPIAPNSKATIQKRGAVLSVPQSN